LGRTTVVLRIKICGITNLGDALAAVGAGADALGFVFAESPRRVTVEAARGIVAGLPPYVTPVGVFVDAGVAEVRRVVAQVGLAAVQLHGAEEPEVVAALAPTPCLKAFRVRRREDLQALSRYRAQGYLLDACVPGRPGGTGVRFDWRVLEGFAAPGPLILSGGLTPQNVAEAVRLVRPYAVDVSSGVEAEPGRKDHALMRRFIEEARSAA
jgi:phosphoribosylanthranilate isomerase